MGRRAKSGAKRRVLLRITPDNLNSFDSYSPEELSELMNRALTSMAPGVELGDRMVSVVRPAVPLTPTICRLFVRKTQVQLLFPEKREDFRDCVKPMGYEWVNPYWLKSVDTEDLRVDRAAEIAHCLLLAGFCVQVESETVKAKAISASYEPEHYRKIAAGTQNPFDGWFRITWPRAEDLYDDVNRITAAKWSGGAMHVPPEMFREVQDFAELHDFWFTHEAEMLMAHAEQAWNQVQIVCPQEHRKRQRRAKGKATVPDGIPDDLRDDD